MNVLDIARVCHEANRALCNSAGDFSQPAWNAIQYALQLFAESECVFHLLNAYTPELHSNRLMAGRVTEAAKDYSENLKSAK